VVVNNPKNEARYSTPLRYPGGKSKLAKFIKLVILQNELLGGDYVEPYAGGAGVALHLLFDGYVKHIHINDLNKSIYAFWYSAIHDTENLCRLIQKTSVTMKNWTHQKSIQEDTKSHSLLELGFSTFFLNRTNRSGILSGGVIGGKEQSGDWSLDARFNKHALIARIEKVSEQRENISLYNQDAAHFINNIIPTTPKKTLVYLDPPYYVKGGELYQNYYGHSEHAMIAKLIAKKIKRKWIVSYDNVKEVRELYNEFRRMTYQLSYSAANRYKGSEVMFFSDSLTIPSIKNPVRPEISPPTLLQHSTVSN
jgi:DNA adenine methylase